MRVKRMVETETKAFIVGDKISIDLQGYGAFTATAHEVTENGTLFIFDDCVCERRMNATDTIEGGFEKSELCGWMNTEFLRVFPDEIRRRMLEDDTGNYLTVPTYGQIFGKDFDDGWDQKNIEIDQREQLPLMKDRSNRIANLDGDYGRYWLQNVIRSSPGFARVFSSGNAGDADASDVDGVRPVFLLN